MFGVAGLAVLASIADRAKSRLASVVVAFGLAMFIGVPVLAQPGLAPRETVTFAVSQTTTVGQSVYVVGDLPELGGNDTSRAIKLSPSAYPLWRASVSLPAGRTYTYRVIVRSDGPTQQNAVATTVQGPFVATTAQQPRATRSKAVWITTPYAQPVLWWRAISPVAGAAFAPVAMTQTAVTSAVRTGDRAGEHTFIAWGMHQAGEAFEFYVTDAAQPGVRTPTSGTLATNLDGVFVQDGQMYTYVPAWSVSGARRAYSPSSVPTIFSPQLNETRGYRVFLPRGYDQHTMRRYPVLYMHDGQNVFESGAFGSWNASGTIATLQASGRMSEVLVVAIDNGPNRLRDYLPSTDSLGGTGRGESYLSFIRDTLKPVIDAQYRTRPEASWTGLMGSSMGAVISLQGVWDFTPTFTRGGLLSGAWQTCPNYLTRVRTTPTRAVRMWLDSGDSGTSADNYWLTLGLRDHFVEGTTAKYALAGPLQHAVGFGQQHNEAAWSARLPDALVHLYPGQEEPSDLLRGVFGPHWDVTGDGVMGIEDVYAQNIPGGPGQRSDADLSGAIDALDALLIERAVRNREVGGMAR